MSITTRGIAGAVIAVLALPAAASAAPSTLGAYWKLDESAGTTAADSSGFGNTGTISGAQHIAGRFGNALTFDGGLAEVRVARSASLEPATMTAEAWVRSPASPGLSRHILSKGASSCGGASYGLYTGNSGGLSFYVAGTEGFTVSADAGTGIWDGTWHHIAGTYDGASLRLFVDGVQVGAPIASSVVVDYGLPDTSDALLGVYGGPCAESHSFSGDIDEARVWDRPLTGVELAASAAMGAPSSRALDIERYSDDTVIHSADFADGNVTVSTESSSGTQRIRSARIVELLPRSSGASCGGLLSSCDITLSNEGRTATLKVRRSLTGLLVSSATVRVTLAGGSSFLVTVNLRG
ncbi:MAG: hypothetical protein JWO02_4669 [Solirubrobacterales bacterium]|nr:hypothetical protein [Solirubrobacterales bacterium]